MDLFNSGGLQNTISRELQYQNLLKQFQDQRNQQVPIYKGCPNSSNHGGCYCTGVCKEIIGYRDKLPNEN